MYALATNQQQQRYVNPTYKRFDAQIFYRITTNQLQDSTLWQK